MDFLREHFEKLVLGLVLTGLLVTSAFLLLGITAAGRTTRSVREQAESVSTATGGEFDAESWEDIDILKELGGALVQVAPPVPTSEDAKANAENLMEPRRFFLCVTSTCRFLLPWATKDCPHCGNKQPPKGEDVEGDDYDKDGLPNFYERLYPTFLSAVNPYDAFGDYDRDGFINLDEFEHETTPDDAADHPLLAFLLRYRRVDRRPLPIRFKSLKTNDSDDPATWSLAFQVTEGRQARNRLVRVGKSLAGYEILSVEQKTASREDPDSGAALEVDVSEVTVKNTETEETYVLIAGEPALEKNRRVLFLYLTNRTDPRACSQFIARENEEFVLPYFSEQQETYKVVSAREGSGTAEAPEPGSVEVLLLKRGDVEIPEQEPVTVDLLQGTDFAGGARAARWAGTTAVPDSRAIPR